MSEPASLPEGWGTATLADLAGSVTSGATPEAGNPRYYTSDGGYAFAKIEDLTHAPTHEIEHCGLQITDAAVRETAAKVYPAGTILLSMYGTIGLAKVCARALTANQALCALLPPFRCDSGYLLHHLDHVRPKWSRYSGQTTQANINGAIVRAHEVPLPPIGDQVAIRQVLDTLDTTIRQTEAIIEKLKQVKHGLLHDLLTRGIDANGELRPPQSQAPDLYKDSALGWIPKEWEVRCLSECAEISSRVTLGRELAGHGVVELPYLRVANVQDGYVDLREVKSVRVLRSEIDRYALLDGDVLMNEGGDFDKLGRGTVWRAQIQPCLHQNHVFRVRCNRDMLLPDFLAAYSASQRGKTFFLLSSKQSTNLASINSTQLKGFPIARPGGGEQRQIVERIHTVDCRVCSESRALQKLEAIKSGLMDDLLTGRVRVTPLLA